MQKNLEKEVVNLSEFRKELSTYLSQIEDDKLEKLAISKNNKVEAVLISKDTYETMEKELESLKKEVENFNSERLNIVLKLKDYHGLEESEKIVGYKVPQAIKDSFFF